MRKIVAFYLVLASAIMVLPAQSQTRIPYEKAPYNDTVIQCGAIFALLADGYEDIGETSKSKIYKEKFDKQFKTSENEFLSVGRSKQEAHELYQERREILVAMAENDIKLMARLVRFCEQKYPL